MLAPLLIYLIISTLEVPFVVCLLARTRWFGAWLPFVSVCVCVLRVTVEVIRVLRYGFFLHLRWFRSSSSSSTTSLYLSIWFRDSLIWSCVSFADDCVFCVAPNFNYFVHVVMIVGIIFFFKYTITKYICDWILQNHLLFINTIFLEYCSTRAALCSFNFYSVLLSVALINICLNLMIVACRRVLTSLCCAVVFVGLFLACVVRVLCVCVCTIILREQIFTVCAPQHQQQQQTAEPI